MAFLPFLYYNSSHEDAHRPPPDALVAEIEAEARRRMVSKSDVVRERLTRPIGERSTAALDQIADLVGSIEGLPSDLSESRRSEHGRKRDR
jgi:hypothetical protein